MKRCILHSDRVCNDCGECDDRCELDPQKICDNCFRCLDADEQAFAQIPISGVFFDDDFSPEGRAASTVDFEEGFVLDSDESWMDDALMHIRTLPMTYGTRVRRTHSKR